MRTTISCIGPIVSCLVMSIGCTDSGDPPGTLQQPIGGAMAATAGTMSAPQGGTTGGTAAPAAGTSGGAPAAMGGAGGEQAMNAMAGTGAGGMGVDPVDGSVVDTSVPDPLDIPEPVTEQAVWAFGLGVSDVPAAVAFYTEVMKMTVEKEVTRSDRTDTVLYAAEADRGARLVLMHFNDGRVTRKITTKLVWQASSPSAVNTAAAMHPDYVSRLNFGIVQFDGPDTYIQEVGSIFDDGGASITVPYLIAMGFAVSDLTASRQFYADALGLTEEALGTFSVTDATGSGSINEYSFTSPGSAGIVVQGWTPSRNAMNNPVMIVMSVPDAQVAADAVVAAGGTIVEPAARVAFYDNRLLIVAKDRDGYVLELVQ